MIGQRLGHYRIVDEIGKGGMGVVYRAHDEQLDRDVAIKVLPASHFRDATARARLLREARAAAALNHPHICTIHEVGEADGQAYIVMELIEGRPLADVIPRGGLAAEDVLRYGAQIADALAHAHEHGIVHRDLKSGNVVITPEGRAKVLDFGLAKRLSHEELVEATTQSLESLTQLGAVLGTLPYMAPELLRGQGADVRSDVWALGVMLHEMAAGARPFQGQTGYELSSAILSQAPAPLPGRVSLHLKAVVERCLKKEPAHRYQRAGEVRAALEAGQKGAVVPWAAWRYRLVRRRWLALVAALLLTMAALVGLNVGGLRNRLFGVAAPAPIDSIAVLPLKNLMGNPEQDYFVEGMHEALTAELSRISALKVISRTSAMRYKDTDKAMPQIARELGVSGLIEGSVLREGDQVRITVQLIHGPSDKHLWGETYERDLEDILVLQSEIAQAVAHEIEVTITPAEAGVLAASKPVKPEAYEAYLRGRYSWSQWTRGDILKSIKYFEEATRLDPGYAPAYAGLADAYVALGSNRHLSAEEAFSKARAVAQKALELDEGLADAHVALANVLFVYDWDWAGAEREFQRALELNPSSVPALQRYGYYLATMDRAKESRAKFQQAKELDPISKSVRSQAAWCLFLGRDFDGVIREAERILELNPNYTAANTLKGLAYVEKGMFAEAGKEFDRVAESSGDEPTKRYYAAYLSAASGRKQEAGRLIGEIMADPRTRTSFLPSEIAVLFAKLDDRKQAMRWLRSTYEEREPGPATLKVDPRFDSLRAEPQFQELLRRLGLLAD